MSPRMSCRPCGAGQPFDPAVDQPDARNVDGRIARGASDRSGRRGKFCLVLSGESRPRWKKAGETIRLPSSERSEGTTACGESDVRPSVKGSIGVRELGHAWARLDCLNSSSSGCVPPPPGKTLKPGFLSHE